MTMTDDFWLTPEGRDVLDRAIEIHRGLVEMMNVHGRAIMDDQPARSVLIGVGKFTVSVLVACIATAAPGNEASLAQSVSDLIRDELAETDWADIQMGMSHGRA